MVIRLGIKNLHLTNLFLESAFSSINLIEKGIGITKNTINILHILNILFYSLFGKDVDSKMKESVYNMIEKLLPKAKLDKDKYTLCEM